MTLATLACSHLRADVDVGLEGQIISNAAGPRFRLLWDGIGGGAYGIQASSNLLAASPWATVDIARPTNGTAGPVRWTAPEVPSSLRFFRLAAPQPEIFSVEPSVFAPGAPVGLYVLGQFFATGDVVHVDGASLGPGTFLDHQTLQALLPPQDAGTHTIEVVRAGNLLASFVVVCASVTTSPEQVLQEPPELPPAAPLVHWLSKKGYDYYQARSDLNAAGRSARKGYDCWKAKSDLSAAGAHTNPYFQENQNAGHTVCVAPSGQLEMQAVDVAIPGRGLDFVWARTYRSRTGPTNSTMGVRWSHSYDVWCVTGATEVVLCDGTGRRDILRRQPNGTFTASGMFREGVMTNSGFRLTFADGGYWDFAAPPGGSTAGKLVLNLLRDRAGNESTCAYDGAGRLSAVVDDLGRTNRIAYHPDGRVASITDFSGRSVTYSYYRGLPGEDGAPGDLASVTSPPVTGTPNTNDFPAGKTTTYTYSHGFPQDVDNHLGLSIIDATGQTVAEFTHEHSAASPDYLSCVSVQRGIDKKDIRREVQTPAPSNRFAVARVFLNDYVGNVAEGFYDARQRCVMLREFTGRAVPGEPVTAVSNRPTGKLRADDPAYYETIWSWNVDSLCTRVVRPRGNAVECVYEADLDKSAPARKRGDLRVVREIAGTDEPDLVTTYEHDPRFGSDPTMARLRTRINELETILKSMGLLGRAAHPDVYIPLKRSKFVPVPDGAEALSLQRLGGDTLFHGSSDATEYEKSVTDPNGTVTLCDYDAQGNRVKVKYPWLPGGDVDFGYDAFGGLVAVTNAADAHGRRRVDAFVRSNGFVVAQMVDAGAGGTNLTTRFERDHLGRVTRCIDPRGHDWLYTCNALGQYVLIETPINVGKRAAMSLFYDANDNLVRADEEVRDESDALTGIRSDTFTYDARQRLTVASRAVDALGAAPTGYAYDGNDNVVRVSGGEGALGLDPANAIACEYDERGLLFREIRAPGSPLAATNTIAYTLNGKAATKQYVDADHATVITYDGFDRPVTVRDAMGNLATRTYDACGNILSTRTDGQTNDVPGQAGNVRLAECFYDYDPGRRCIRTREAHFDPATQAPVGDGFRTTTLSYAPNGALTAVTDDLLHVTRLDADAENRLERVTDALSNRVEYAYDENGNVVTETRRERSDLGGAEQVFILAHAYDALDRRVRTVDNAGNTNRWRFNSLGHCVQEIDPRGVSTFRTFDLLGRCTATIRDLDGDGLPSLAHDYSERALWSSSNPDRLLAALDGHGHVTSFAYDSLDRCTNTLYADGTQRKLLWSPRSNLIRQEDPNGTVVLLDYDQNDRCIGKAITPGAGVATNTTFEAFEFDGLGRLVRHRDDDADGRFAYDSLGSCVRETLDGLDTLSTFDALGHRTSLAYPGGRTFTFARDLLGRCSTISESAFALAAYEFDGPDRVARISYLNNMRTRIFYDGAVGTTNQPGDVGWRQVVGIRHAVSGTSPIIHDATFAWDRAGNQVARTERILPPALPRTNSLALTYDLQGRLTHALLTSGSTLVRDTAYDFDLVGNRTNVSGAACAGAYQLDALLPGPQDFQMNQYTATPCDGRAYDENGNLITVADSAALSSYRYDYAGRLVSITRTGALVATYAYDALGRRIARTLYPDSLPPATTRYAYDLSNVIEERSGTNVVASYLHPANGGLERPGPLSMRRGGADYYVHADDQGRVVALTDANALCVERYLYDDYGAVTFLTSDGLSNAVSASVVGNPYLFRGMRYDAESALHLADDRALLGLRNYDPARDYLIGDSVIYNQSVYEARTGRSISRRPPNIPPLPGMCPGLALVGAGGSSGPNNPWSGDREHTRSVLKEKFQTGDIPDQQDFADLIDSTLNLPEDRFLLGLRSAGGGGGALYLCPILPRSILKDYVGGTVPAASIVHRNILKTFFATGDKPTQSQFGSLIDSTVQAADRHKELTGHVTLIK